MTAVDFISSAYIPSFRNKMTKDNCRIGYPKSQTWILKVLTFRYSMSFDLFFFFFVSFTFLYSQSPLHDMHKHGEQRYGTFGVTRSC